MIFDALKKPIYLSVLLSITGCFGRGPAPQPIGPSQPSAIPSPSPSSSGQSSQRVLYAEGTRIISPIQVLALNAANSGLVLWQEALSLQQPQFKGAFLKNGQVEREISFSAPDISLMKPGLFLDATGSGNLVWSSLKVAPLGSGNPKALSIYPLKNYQGNASFTELGSYSLQSMTTNDDGDGFLLVSNEREPQRSAVASAQTRVYLIPLSKGMPQIQALNKAVPDAWQQQEAGLQIIADLPFHLGGQNVILAAQLSLAGNGLILFRDAALKPMLLNIADFKPAGEAQALEGLPEDLDASPLRLKLSNGNGYLLWQNANGLAILPIQNDVPAKNPRQLSFPVQATCRFANLPVVPAWDIDMDAQGNGVVSWVGEDRQQIVVQQVNAFTLASTHHALTPPPELGVCMTKVQQISPTTAMLAALSTACPEQFCESPLLEPQKMIWSSKVGLK